MIKYFKILLFSTIAIIMLNGCNTNRIVGYSLSEMKDKTVVGMFSATNNITFPYRAYISSYENRCKLIFMMHGAGERGSDNEQQLVYGINHMAKYAEEHNLNVVVIAPQCPHNMYWKDHEMMDALGEFIEKMCRMPYVYSNNVCMTGFSMGGDCSWHCLMRYPSLIEKFAPICGGPLLGTIDKEYFNIPTKAFDCKIWAINYLDDIIVDNTYSKYVVGFLWLNDSRKIVHYTENFSGGHTAMAYEDPEFLNWIMMK